MEEAPKWPMVYDHFLNPYNFDQSPYGTITIVGVYALMAHGEHGP